MLNTIRSPRSRLVAGFAVAVVGTTLLTGCANWWVPQVPQTQEGVLPSGGAEAASAAAVLELGTLESDVPAAWNATAAANGSEIVLPDELAADDTSAGTSTAVLALGDYTLTLLWRDDTGELSFAELDGPIEDDPATADLAVVAESLLSAVLGLSVAESNAFVQDLIATSVAESTDPTTASGAAVSGPGTVTFDMSGGTAMFLISPGE